MGTNNLYYVVLFVLVLFLQLFLFNQINLFIPAEYSPYVLIYPLFYLLLPVQFNRSFLILMAFVLGLIIDFSQDSLGVHAGASVMGAFCRKYVLNILESKTGFSSNSVPNLRENELLWIMQYNFIVLFIHGLWLFTLEIFTFYFVFSILIKALLTAAISTIALLIIQLLYRSK